MQDSLQLQSSSDLFARKLDAEEDIRTWRCSNSICDHSLPINIGRRSKVRSRRQAPLQRFWQQLDRLMIQLADYRIK